MYRFQNCEACGKLVRKDGVCTVCTRREEEEKKLNDALGVAERAREIIFYLCDFRCYYNTNGAKSCDECPLVQDVISRYNAFFPHRGFTRPQSKLLCGRKRVFKEE